MVKINMKTIEFKLPKTLHDGNSFTHELIINNEELWTGYSKNIIVSSRNEYIKINNTAIFSFCVDVSRNEPENMLPFVSIPIGCIPECEKVFGVAIINSIYDITTVGVDGNKHPLRLEKTKVLISLKFDIKDRKYMRFKKEPVILVNIFTEQTEGK